jgi:subtilisin family serine protease/sugar lactone lactonase YvrE
MYFRNGILLILLAALGVAIISRVHDRASSSEAANGHPAKPQTIRGPVAAPVTAPDAGRILESRPDSAPGLPVSPAQPWQEARNSLIDEGELVIKKDTPIPNSNELKRVRILRCEGKYPMLRVEEHLVRDGPTGEERLLHRTVAVADHAVVRLRPGADPRRLAAIAGQWGGGVLRGLKDSGLFLVRTPADKTDSLPDTLALLQREEIVEYAEPDYVVHVSAFPNDTDFSRLWGLHNTGQGGALADADIDAPEAWNLTTGNQDVVVAVIDTGVQYTHPDLAANMWSNPGEIDGNGVDDDGNGYVDDARGWNFHGDSSNPDDDHFHGTHCAGTVGAIGDNGTGVAGVCWQVKIMPLKFLSASGGGYTSDAIDAIHYARVMQARIMSNSWGGGGYSQALKDAITAASDAGILFVAAAGNDGKSNDMSPSYPAGYDCPNIISVAASDDRDELAGFSNYGSSTVHIAAPGVGIHSTFPTTVTPEMAAYGLPASYARISGTSMATPHVSGVAALALAQDPGLTMAQLRARLLNRADTVTRFVGKVQGARRLNAFHVVNPSWQPGPAQMVLTEYDLDDSVGGDGDGIPGPGETVTLSPSLMNVGGMDAVDVTVELVSQQAGATVLAPTVLALGSLPPLVAGQPSQSWQVHLGGALADNSEVSFDVVIRSTGIADRHETLTLLVSQPQPVTETVLPFSAGEMIADPGRNRVYLLNKTDSRVLAIDTDNGQVAAFAGLDGSAEIFPTPETASLASGHLAISLDGSRLYVALTAAKKIQVFSLPDLSPLNVLPTDFAPESLACAANGRLYASSTDYWGPLRQVNTTTGQVVQEINGSGRQIYRHSLLRTNAAGTRLFLGETGLLAYSGPAYVLEYDITGTNASLIDYHPYWMRGMRDFRIDDSHRRIYTANGGIYGLQVTEMDSGNFGETWSSDLYYPLAIAFLPNAPVVYCASGDKFSGKIRTYRRSDGRFVRDYLVATDIHAIPPRGMVITPNGRLLYLRGNSILGIIGLNSLTISNPPPQPGPSNLTVRTINFGDSEGNLDGVPNAGEIIALTPELANVGGTTAAGVTVELSAGTGASLLSASTQSLGSLAPGASANAAAYRIQLNSGLATGTPVQFTFTASWDTNQVKTFSYTIIIRSTTIVNESASTLQFGEILADQQRNLVYFTDKRHRRLMAFDTNSCHMSLAAPLDGPAKTNGKPSAPGMMAQSVDGSRLYVALNQAKGIQVFSLPDLTSLGTWFYPFEPIGISCDGVGRVYVTTSNTAQKLVQIDGASGAILSQTGAAFDSKTMLRRNAAGTELYANLGFAIHRYDTSGNQPVIMATYNTATWGSIDDFALDEANSRLYVIVTSASGLVTVVPLNGGTNSTWSLPSNLLGSAVVVSPAGNQVLGGSENTYGGGIRRFDRSTGTALQDYITNNIDTGSLIDRGLAATPNGRILYVKRMSTGQADPDSVDGFFYRVGMIGGSVDLDLPASPPVVMKSVTLTDPATGGNGDGYVNQGETVKLDPTFKNLSDYPLTNVSVKLVSSDLLAVVQSPATFTIGSVDGYASFKPSSPFAIKLNASIPDAREIKLTFQVTGANGFQQNFPYSIYNSKMVSKEVTAGFSIGEMIADRTRNLAYVIDNTNLRLLAIDTTAGGVSAVAALAAGAGSGRLALSPDGSRLYVALGNGNRIQVFRLPKLEEEDLISVGFSPLNVAAASDGMLYASNGTTSDKPWKIDPEFGQALGKFGRSNYSAGTPMVLSTDASRLYIAGTTSVDEYEISADAMPTYTQQYAMQMNNVQQLAIDEAYQRFYRIQSTIYGIGITEMDTGISGIRWLNGGTTGPYGRAVCFMPDSPFVYGGSTSDGVVRFNRADGRRLGVINLGSDTLLNRALAITPNGRILYAKNSMSASYLGIIGASSFTMNTVNRAPLIDLGANRTVYLSHGAQLTAAVSDDGPTAGFTASWEMVSGPRGANVSGTSAMAATASFAATGTYLIRATVSDGSLSASDLITLTVIPDKPAVSITASRPTGTRSGPIPGVFIFTRTQFVAAPLTAKYTITGTATAGTDYVTLSGTASFPAGASSVSVNVTPHATAPPFGDGRSVIVNLTADASYDLGVSAQATITLKDHDYAAWRANLPGYSPSSSAGHSTDSDGDGISDLMEYALSLNPLHASVGGLPTLGRNGDRLTLTYTRRRPPAGVVYQVEGTDDFTDWDNDGVTEEVQPLNDLFETVTATDDEPVSTGGRRFLRLRVLSP